MVETKLKADEQAVTHYSESQDAFSDAEVSLVRVDKIASSTVNLGLDHEMEVVTRLAQARKAKAGDAVVVRTLTDNATYNTLELVTGRMAKINPGDVIVGVLGYRRALKGVVGDVPESIKPGSRLHRLNLRGPIGPRLRSPPRLNTHI